MGIPGKEANQCFISMAALFEDTGRTRVKIINQEEYRSGKMQRRKPKQIEVVACSEQNAKKRRSCNITFESCCEEEVKENV
jgi:hypothetical protein